MRKKNKLEGQDDIVTVQLDVIAKGFIVTKMTRTKFDEIFCNGKNTVDLDEVLTDWSTVIRSSVDDMIFEVSDAVIMKPMPKHIPSSK